MKRKKGRLGLFYGLADLGKKWGMHRRSRLSKKKISIFANILIFAASSISVCDVQVKGGVILDVEFLIFD